MLNDWPRPIMSLTRGVVRLTLGCLLMAMLRGVEARAYVVQEPTASPTKDAREMEAARARESEQVERGIRALENRHFQDAVGYFTRARQADPSNPLLAAVLGRALLKAGNPAAAIDPLKEALAARPHDKGILLMLAQSYQKLNKDPEVVDLLGASQKDGVLDPALLFVLSFSRFRMSQFKQAEDGFRKMVGVVGIEAPASFFIANCRFGDGDLAGALPWYEKAIRIGQTSEVVGLNVYFYDYGLALYRLNRFADAQSAFQSSIKLYPSDPLPRFFLGRATAKTGEIEKAISIFSTLAHEHPDFSPVYYQLANLYRKKGDAPRARAMFAKVAKAKNQELESQRLLMKLEIGTNATQTLSGDR